MKHSFPRWCIFVASFLTMVLFAIGVATWAYHRYAPYALNYPDITEHENPYPAIVSLSELFADRDHENSQLRLVIVHNSNPALVTATVSPLGDLDLEFARGRYGVANLHLRAIDPFGLSAVDELGIRVNGRPAPKTPSFVPVIVDAGTLSSSFSAYEFFDDPEDPDQALKFSITNDTNWDLLEDSQITTETGEITLKYRAGQTGRTTLTLRALDTKGADATVDFDVVVRPLGD